MDSTIEAQDVQIEPIVDPPTVGKAKKRVPQANVDRFWTKFNTAFPGKVHTILPQNVYAQAKAAQSPRGTVHSQRAVKSYVEAAAECRAAVEKISIECRRVNLKYRDPHFDIEWDLKCKKRDCLDGLWDEDISMTPRSVKRISYIFDDPVFYQEGATAGDVRQGNNGDCWFMSALCALGNKKNLIDKVCVHRDEAVGVYGFVFHRDGEWFHTIIDDKLYLIAADFDESDEEKRTWQQVSMEDPEEEYRKSCQTGSRALYFAQCNSENETWLPLLEKAYAKAHGDFNAIQGGFTGEAIEDLTGGVTTELFASDILDTEKFWTDEIMKVNQEFLFGCATGNFDNWQGTDDWTERRKGIKPRHAYSIMEAREVKGERLLRLRNPWGRSEWNGPWSDGSEQWTPEWMQLLGHRFGDDGMFWISYKDLLRKYQSFDRTRLFGADWNITQQWTTVNVPWTADYNDTKFSITLTKKGPVVIVLSQLDYRYFQGLEGQYIFQLHFRLEKEGESDYIVRSHGNYFMRRSVSTDIELEPGTYSVLMRITAKRWAIPDRPMPEQVIRERCIQRHDKLIQIGLAYDLAHAKGQIKETEREKGLRKQHEERKKAADRLKQRKELRERKFKVWQIQQRQKARDNRHAQKRTERRRKKAEIEKAAHPEGEGPLKAPAADELGVTDEDPAAEQQNARIEEESAPIPDGGTETEQTEPETPTPPSPTTGTEPTHPAGTAEPKPIQEAEIVAIYATAENTTAEGDLSQKLDTALLLVDDHDSNTPSIVDDPSSHHHRDYTDYDSDSSFNSSIDSLLDFPSSPSIAPADSTVAEIFADGDESTDEEDAEFANDPWNAVCVVGLRVYSKDPQACVEVIRPKMDGEYGEAPLDVDDISKGVSGEKVEEASGQLEKREKKGGVKKK